jgi:uncharacterized protein
MSRLIVAAVTILCVLSGSPARAQDLNAAFRADLEQLLDVTGAVANGAKVGALVGSQLVDAMRARQPQMPPRAGEIVKELLNESIGSVFNDPAWRDELVQIYGRHFTPDDVRGLVAFYSSELGRKATSLMPLLAAEATAASQKRIAETLPRFQQELQQRLRDEKLIP